MEYKGEFDGMAFVKTPPWYTYGARLQGVAGLYFDGGHPKDGNFAAFTYLTAFLDPDGDHLREALTGWAEGGHHFLASLEPPPYPFPVDASLLPEGRSLYTRHCADCHGHYQGEPAAWENLLYPGRIIPVDEVGTDPFRAELPEAFVLRMREVLRDEYRPNAGYVAVPLHAIWARAPYLHNGSVPTLATLLQPDNRPRRWALLAHPDRTQDYLQAEVGWRYEVLGEEPVGDRQRVHDPEVVQGLGGEGHRYGEELSAEERAALIEFLKTL